MKSYIFIFIFIACESTFAIDKLQGTAVADSCAVRLSNEKINASEPNDGTSFCSGSIIENGTILITAAHCLNQVFDSKADLLKDSSIEIAFPGDANSEKLILKKGQYSILAGELLDTSKKRDTFLETGDPKYIKDDVVLIKLGTALKNDPTCPVLPNLADCALFEKNVLEFGRGVNLQSDFFVSNVKTAPGSTHKTPTAWYPSKTVFRVQATDVMFSPSSAEIKNDQAPIKLSFQLAEKEVRMRKGDSGSLTFWKNGPKNVAIGIQSATISGTPNKAYFANLCKQVSTKRFSEFIKQSTGTDTPKTTLNDDAAVQ